MSFLLKFKLEVYLSRASQKKKKKKITTTLGVCYAYTTSPNPSVVEVGIDLWRASCPISLLKHSHLEEAGPETSWYFGTYCTLVHIVPVQDAHMYAIPVYDTVLESPSSAFKKKSIHRFLGKK